MGYHSSHQATQADVDAYRDVTRERFKDFPFTIDSNGAGLRVECTTCHDSATRNPEQFMHEHTCAPDTSCDRQYAPTP